MCWRVFSEGSGQLEPLGFPQRDGNLAKRALISPTWPHGSLRTRATYGKASCAQVPSLASRTLEAHLGSLEAHVTRQGVGGGLAAVA